MVAISSSSDSTLRPGFCGATLPPSKANRLGKRNGTYRVPLRERIGILPRLSPPGHPQVNKMCDHGHQGRPEGDLLKGWVGDDAGEMRDHGRSISALMQAARLLNLILIGEDEFGQA